MKLLGKFIENTFLVIFGFLIGTFLAIFGFFIGALCGFDFCVFLFAGGEPKSIEHGAWWLYLLVFFLAWLLGIILMLLYKRKCDRSEEEYKEYERWKQSVTVNCTECNGGGVVQDPMSSLSGCGGGMSCPNCGGSERIWAVDEIKEADKKFEKRAKVDGWSG